MRLASVVLHDYGVSVYDDTRAMLDYAFENITSLPLEVEENTELKKKIESFKDNTYVTVPKGVTLSDLESKITIMDEKEGTGLVTYRYKGETVGSVHVKLTKEYMESQGSEQDLKIEQKENEEKKSPEAGDPDRNIKARVSIGIAAILLVLVLMIGMKYRKI